MLGNLQLVGQYTLTLPSGLTSKWYMVVYTETVSKLEPGTLLSEELPDWTM